MVMRCHGLPSSLAEGASPEENGIALLGKGGAIAILKIQFLINNLQ